MQGAAHDQVPHALAGAAHEVACLALIDSLACAFKALQDPTCTQLLGALVPGATMAFGARVPGTSYQLDPVQAAFNLGTMVSWLQAHDPALATASGYVADNLGAILAVADYRARKAIAEGESPPRVHDLFAALIRAHELASLEWARLVGGNAAFATTDGKLASAGTAARCALTRIASAAGAVTLLGGSEDQVTAAVAIARGDGLATSYPGTAPDLDGNERWRIGDATSRGVRLALITLAGQATPLPLSTPGKAAVMQRVVLAELDQAWQAVAAAPTVAGRVRDRFTACVASHFPAPQAGKLAAMFVDRASLDALPVNELVSMTVRN
jgi:2-methylcitrate dehydratase